MRRNFSSAALFSIAFTLLVIGCGNEYDLRTVHDAEVSDELPADNDKDATSESSEAAAALPEKPLTPAAQNITPSPSPAAPAPVVSTPPAPAGKIQDLDFELPIRLSGATETMKQGVIIAYTIELAKIRNEYPDLYEKIKRNLRSITLDTSNQGRAGGSSITTTANVYKNGFVMNRSSIPIHELSHTIHMNFRSTSLAALSKTIASEYSTARSGGSGFISDYSRTNEHEFFAESTEAWFYLPSASSSQRSRSMATGGHATLKTVNPAMYELCSKLYYAPDGPEVTEYLKRKLQQAPGSSLGLLADGH
jgi:hypothetical protein